MTGSGPGRSEGAAAAAASCQAARRTATPDEAIRTLRSKRGKGTTRARIRDESEVPDSLAAFSRYETERSAKSPAPGRPSDAETYCSYAGRQSAERSPFEGGRSRLPDSSGKPKRHLACFRVRQAHSRSALHRVRNPSTD